MPGSPGGGAWRAVVRVLLTSIALLLTVAVVVTPLDLARQVLFGGAAVGLALVLARSKRREAGTIMALVSVVVSSRYVFWRLTTTLDAPWSLDTALGLVLLAAELYAFVMLLLGYVQSAMALPRQPIPLPSNESAWPTVDVFIPTYNEPLPVVRATVLAARAMDWPADKLRVHLLDDGRRDQFRQFAAQAGVGYVVRPDNRHAKAGNLNHALTCTDGELVAIFDCDHVPTRAFLQLTCGWFLRDERLAIVQTPHHFYSPNPFERNLDVFRRVPSEDELFYGLIQACNDTFDATFFCGSCAVIRRRALVEVGGIAEQTVTEDAHTSLRMHRRGWSTAFLDVPLAAGLATESLGAHVGQRIRWARGMAQIFRIDNPLFGRGLKPMQRLCYSASMLHFFSGVPRLVFLLAPLSYLLFGLHIFNALPLVALAYALPHLALSVVTNSHLQGRHRHSFWSEVYETCLAWYIAIPTTLALFNPRAGRFNVTAKGGRIEHARFDGKLALPALILAILNVTAALVAIVRWHAGLAEPAIVAINLAWTAHNVLVLAVALAVARERRQVRASPRVEARLPAMLRLASGATLRAETRDLSLGGGAIAVPGQREFATDEALLLSLHPGADECALEARVVASQPGLVRVRFEVRSLEEEAALVETIFSRADAWCGWKDGRAPDRPLASLLGLTSHATRGLARLVPVRRPRSEAPKAAPSVAPVADVAGGRS